MAEYRIRVPQVVHETVDGEVVAIDFTTGSYYSLRGPAEAVWAALAAGDDGSPDTIAGTVATRYADDGDPDRVAAFLDHLVDEGLVERSGPAAEPAGTTDPGGLVVEKYTDMEEIILLDPVHDVSEAGWPNAPA